MGTFGVGMGASVHGSAHPVVLASVAALRERLGDQRAIGFAPTSEVRLLDVEGAAGFADGHPELEWLDVKLIRFLTARIQLPLFRESWRDGFGFGLGVESRTDALNRTRADGYVLLLKHAANGEFSRYVGIGLGPAVQIAWQPAARALLGARAEVNARIPIGSSAIHLAAMWRPAWDFSRRAVAYEAGGAADVEFLAATSRIRLGGSAERTPAGFLARATISAELE